MARLASKVAILLVGSHLSIWCPGSFSVHLCTSAVQGMCDNAGASKASACLRSTCHHIIRSYENETGDAFKKRMLEFHNQVRKEGFHGKKGSNMMEIEWDDGLATIACRYIQYLCERNANPIRHEQHECRTSPLFDSVGQNLYRIRSRKNQNISGEDIGTLAMNAWYAEINQATEASMFPFSSSTQKIGHYTQMVWAQSYRMGCCYLIYQRTSSYDAIVACNYAKGGNYLGRNVFEPGELGSNCMTGTRRGNSGLCQVDNETEFRNFINLKGVI